MSAATFTSFAVAGGTGGLGHLIASELVAVGAKVAVLTRPDSNSKLPPGAEARQVDYSSEASLLKALEGIEAVVSVLAGAGFAVQTPLADAAKKAGVKLFVPSEFGLRTSELSDNSVAGGKGLTIAKKSISFVGEGHTPVSFTTRPDIARFTAYTLTHLPLEQLSNATLGVEGDRQSFRELVKIFGEVIEDAEKKVEREGLAAFKGLAHVGEPQNQLVPGFKPLNVPEALKKYFL
ncbi:NAD(P)-binding protein [Auriculariales sp. MPI-PUGE-AT-0066]|nr:NAD(P)-binding protein [Auriculariales sp. MPI-PUGE-AT-0066]